MFLLVRLRRDNLLGPLLTTTTLTTVNLKLVRLFNVNLLKNYEDFIESSVLGVSTPLLDYLISPPTGGFFDLCFLILSIMFTLTRFVLNTRSYIDTRPKYVYIFTYPCGKVRVHRRGYYHRIDRWYKTFEEVVPLIESLVNSEVYNLCKSFEPVDYWKETRVEEDVVSELDLIRF